jgi:hypothetical protein
MRKFLASLVFPSYILGVIFIGYTGVSGYLNANFILEDSTVVNAPMEFVRTTSRTKKGHTTVSYLFTYSYTVDDREYVSHHTAVNEHGERYLENPVLEIAYSNADPSKAGLLSTLETRASLWQTIKGFLMMWLIVSIGALFTFGWLAAGIPDEEELEEAAPEEDPGRQAQGA